jgi:uncharacterized protein
MRWIVLLPAALLWSGGAGAQTFPPLTGRVVDAANVLPPAVEADLSAKLEALERDTQRQLVVATIADAQGYPLEDYGYRLGRAWGIGQKGTDNGAILFVAPNNPAGQRGPRIEVGYGLEPLLTDALSSQIIRRDMMPRLKEGDVPGAMTAGTDALVTHLRSDPGEAKARTDAAAASVDRPRQRGGGGGVPVALIFWMIVLAFVVLPMFRRRSKAGPWGRKHRRGGGGGDVLLWAIASGLSQGSSRSSGWGGAGGFGGGGFGGGGGFSGGGGSFGGGGASGSW